MVKLLCILFKPPLNLFVSTCTLNNNNKAPNFKQMAIARFCTFVVRTFNIDLSVYYMIYFYTPVLKKKKKGRQTRK